MTKASQVPFEDALRLLMKAYDMPVAVVDR
jgi:hypothetical protein